MHSNQIAAPVQSFTSFSPILPMPQSFPAFANTPAFANMYYSSNIVTMSQNQNPSNFQTFGKSQSHLAPCYSNLEKWAMFFLAHFCIQCCFPFQNHCKSDNVCVSCVTLGYQVHNIEFVNHWVQAYPNEFENCHIHDPSIIPCKPYMIMAERVAESSCSPANERLYHFLVFPQHCSDREC